jgi:hypothetical protein
VAPSTGTVPLATGGGSLTSGLLEKRALDSEQPVRRGLADELTAVVAGGVLAGGVLASGVLRSASV